MPLKSKPDVVVYRGNYPGWPWVAAASGGRLVCVLRDDGIHGFSPTGRVMITESRDGGRSWLDSLLTFSGHLYGYNAESPRPSDLGYPSSALIQQGSAAGQGVTMYYYNTAKHPEQHIVATIWDPDSVGSASASSAGE